MERLRRCRLRRVTWERKESDCRTRTTGLRGPIARVYRSGMNSLADLFVLLLILGTVVSGTLFAIGWFGWWGIALVAGVIALFVAAAVAGHQRRNAGKT